jgi:hypothetical protein
VVSRAGDVIRRAGAGVARLGQPRYPSGVPSYPQEISQYPVQAMLQKPIRSEPRVTAVSERSSILNVPNIFDRPGEATIGFGRKRV